MRRQVDAVECGVPDLLRATWYHGAAASLHQPCGCRFDDGVAIAPRIVHRIAGINGYGAERLAVEKRPASNSADALENPYSRERTSMKGIVVDGLDAFRNEGGAATGHQDVRPAVDDGVAVVPGIERAVPLVHLYFFLIIASAERIPVGAPVVALYLRDVTGNGDGFQAHAVVEHAIAHAL